MLQQITIHSSLLTSSLSTNSAISSSTQSIPDIFTLSDSFATPSSLKSGFASERKREDNNDRTTPLDHHEQDSSTIYRSSPIPVPRHIERADSSISNKRSSAQHHQDSAASFQRKKDPSHLYRRRGLSPIPVPLQTDERASSIPNQRSSPQHPEHHTSSHRKKDSSNRYRGRDLSPIPFQNYLSRARSNVFYNSYRPSQEYRHQPYTNPRNRPPSSSRKP